MVIGIIPARHASSRFPGKPLVDIRGKSMIQRVYEQASKTPSLQRVIVATDDARIEAHVQAFGGEVMRTAADHPSGTDRCAEVVARLGGAFEAVVNIQGDEPYIFPEQIEEIIHCLQQSPAPIATLARPIQHSEDLFNPNVVKVVCNQRQEALYFSRAAIPHLRDTPQEAWIQEETYLHHVGMYAFQKDTLRALTKLERSRLERAEALEQLRWLDHGYRIAVGITHYESWSVDTPEDLLRLPQND